MENNNEEIVILDGREVVLSHTPVRMLTESGEVVGMGTLDEVVAQKLWCRSVHAWMVNKAGELYIQQRSYQVFNNPGKWAESCGGYVDGDMTEDETLEEEAHQELGLELVPSDYRKLGIVKQLETRFDGTLSQQFVTVYLIEKDFSEDKLVLCERDVIQGKKIHWRVFKDQFEKNEIDFVYHKEEIDMVLGELAEKYA